jgi:hypothetical protein
MSSNLSNKEFLDEIKSHYKIELETQQNLDNKISSLMATSGTVTGLLFGFGTFLVTKILLNYEFLYFSIASLIIAILANLVSFILCMLAYKIKNYFFIMREGFIVNENTLTHEEILALTKDENIENKYFNNIKIDKYEKMEVSKFYHIFIRFYLIANAINKKNNDAKGIKIFYAQIIFLLGLIFIPILLGFLIHAYFIDAIHLSSD